MITQKCSSVFFLCRIVWAIDFGIGFLSRTLQGNAYLSGNWNWKKMKPEENWKNRWKSRSPSTPINAPSNLYVLCWFLKILVFCCCFIAFLSFWVLFVFVFFSFFFVLLIVCFFVFCCLFFQFSYVLYPLGGRGALTPGDGDVGLPKP